MTRDVTSSANQELFEMGECIVGITEDQNEGEVLRIDPVTATNILEVTDEFPEAKKLGIDKVYLVFGRTSVGPVCEFLEYTNASGGHHATNPLPETPSTETGFFDKSFSALFYLNCPELDENGLGRLNFTNPDELSAKKGLLASRVVRMGGDTVDVANIIFENVPYTEDQSK
jgi:hypothetical protein